MTAKEKAQAEAAKNKALQDALNQAAVELATSQHNATVEVLGAKTTAIEKAKKTIGELIAEKNTAIDKIADECKTRGLKGKSEEVRVAWRLYSKTAKGLCKSDKEKESMKNFLSATLRARLGIPKDESQNRNKSGDHGSDGIPKKVSVSTEKEYSKDALSLARATCKAIAKQVTGTVTVREVIEAALTLIVSGTVDNG